MKKTKLTWSGGNGNWRWGDSNWSGSDGNWRRHGRSCDGHWGGGHVDRCVVAHLRSEGVAVDVGGLANDLVANVLVASDGGSSLDGLQDCGWARNSVHGRCLWNETLAVDGGQRGHGRDGWHGGDSGRSGNGGRSVDCLAALAWGRNREGN